MKVQSKRPGTYGQYSRVLRWLHDNEPLKVSESGMTLVDLEINNALESEKCADRTSEASFRGYIDISSDGSSVYCLNSSQRKSGKTFEYMTFTPESLKHISRSTAPHKKERYTQMGEQLNLLFKMVRSGTRLIKTLLHSHGFTQCSSKNPSFNILWTGAHMRAPKMRFLQPWQRLNQFPRSNELTRKDKLYENIARTQAIYGRAFNFIPEFYVTPRDFLRLETALKEECEGNPVTYIVKPVSASRGQGIFFASKIEEIPQDGTLLVSHYIERPFLVNGHKFDLRIYVAVTSFYPLVVYVYSEGLTRLASVKYCSELTTRDSYVHLTNYSINKNSIHFVRNESMSSEDFGHKWTLGALLRHLEKKGIDSKLLMIRLEDIIIKSLLSVQSMVSATSKIYLQHLGTNFELFGFDILVDEQLKPWLLEVNLSPSLSCDAPLDSLVKTHLICDLFNLACVPLVNRKVIENHTKIPSFTLNDYESELEKDVTLKGERHRNYARRPLGIKRGLLPRSTGGEQRVRAILRRVRAEYTRKGDFVRIFPRKGSYLMYRNIMDKIGTEKLDERLYAEEFGLAESDDNNKELSERFHEVIMKTKEYPSLSSIPSDLRVILREWYDSARAYMEKITVEGEIYAAKLPVVRPSARLRTRSCAEWYEGRKSHIAEAKQRVRIERPEDKENATPS